MEIGRIEVLNWLIGMQGVLTWLTRFTKLSR